MKVDSFVKFQARGNVFEENSEGLTFERIFFCELSVYVLSYLWDPTCTGLKWPNEVVQLALDNHTWLPAASRW